MTELQQLFPIQLLMKFKIIMIVGMHQFLWVHRPFPIPKLFIMSFFQYRYLLTCEAAWRNFGFEIHYRYPPVQRLSFHLPQEKTIIYKDGESIEDVLKKADTRKSMFEAWMEANKKYVEARNLTYAEFLTKFVYKEDKQEWVPRKKGFAIGRINHVSPGNGEYFYLRILINFQKGCKCYEDIRTINNIQYPSFKDACYSLGLLDDDKEYIDGIKEASFWSSAHQLRRLFANLLFSNSMTRPEFVWETCWKYMSDDILQHQRRLIGHQGILIFQFLNLTYMICHAFFPSFLPLIFFFSDSRIYYE